MQVGSMDTQVCIDIQAYNNSILKGYDYVILHLEESCFWTSFFLMFLKKHNFLETGSAYVR
jgi:hypothetical protein